MTGEKRKAPQFHGKKLGNLPSVAEFVPNLHPLKIMVGIIASVTFNVIYELYTK
jgi:hypothetical protein